jgi:hypothetical protein
LTRLSSHKCAFCEFRGRLSKEHLWPDWLWDFFGSSDDRTVHFTNMRRNDPGSDKMIVVEKGRGKLDRPGHFLRQTLRIVCKSCNNGWMSRAVNEAKPHLLPLLEGRIGALDAVASDKVVSLLVLMTMVYEYAHLPTLAVPQRQREQFRDTLAPPHNWRAWLGFFDRDCSMFRTHRGMAVGRVGQVWPEQCNAQITTFGLGRLFAMTVSSSREGARLDQVHSFPNAPICSVLPYEGKFPVGRLHQNDVPPIIQNFTWLVREFG